MKDERQQKCMTTSTVADTCQKRVKQDDLMIYFAWLGCNVTIKAQRTRTVLLGEALREMSTSEQPSFRKGLQLIWEDILAVPIVYLNLSNLIPFTRLY